MGEVVRRTVVVSAVNIRKGGTLTILRSCLEYLSGQTAQYRIVALVHNKELCNYPGIEYIEMPQCIKSWGRRLWAEYVTMHRLSRQIARQNGEDKVWMWLSLHDTTPRVVAEHREVYMQTSFPFMKVKLQDFAMDPKIALFCFLTRWICKINVNKNDSIIVQQNWFADSMARKLHVERSKFRVIPPEFKPLVKESVSTAPQSDLCTFLFVSTPDCHKNFETLCRAAQMLEGNKFKVILTISGSENRYSKHIYKKYGSCASIDFHGLVGKAELYNLYESADCFVFPSRIETWGLPISEFSSVQPNGHMLLSDLPYAHETAAGHNPEAVQYFNPGSAKELATLMEKVLHLYQLKSI